MTEKNQAEPEPAHLRIVAHWHHRHMNASEAHESSSGLMSRVALRSMAGAFALCLVVVTACADRSNGSGATLWDGTEAYPERVMAAAQVETWTVSEDLRIGSVDEPNYALSEVVDLAADAAGALAVVQWNEQSVLIFSPTGQFVRDLGRGGQGPGEFGMPVRIGLLGDTTWVTDGTLKRTTLFDSRGTAVETLDFTRPISDDPRFRSAPPSAMLRDGSAIVRPIIVSRGAGPGFAPLLRLRRDGSVVDTIAMLDRRNSRLRIQDPSGTWTRYTSQPFNDGTLFAAASNGQGIVVVERPAARSEPAYFRVRKLAPDGRIEYAKRYRYRPVPMNGTVMDSVLNELAGSITESGRPGAPSMARARQWVREGLYVPGNHPPVSAVVMSQDGHVWLRREDRPDALSLWHVLDRSGAIVAQSRIPPNVRLLEASQTHLWGVVTDELDVPYIVRYRIQRQEP